MVRRPRPAPAGWGAVPIVVAAFAAGCGLLVAPLSDDVWAYAAYGALLTDGGDPWAHAYTAVDAARFRDPLLARALAAWQGSLPRDVYGPLFTLPVAALVAAARPIGPDGTILALRGLGILGLLACIVAAAQSLPRLVPLLAFHPVVLWSAAEGHNDVFWLALVLAAGTLRRKRLRLGLLMLAATIKAIALVPLAGELLGPSRDRRVLLIAAIVLGAAYAPLESALLLHGTDHSVGPPRVSLLHAVALGRWSGSILPLVVALVLGAVAVAAVVRLLRLDDRLGAATLAGWLALPAPQPWYALWLVPVVALIGRTPGGWALLAASLSGAFGYVPDAVAGTALRDPALLGGTMVALYALPLLLALKAPAPSPQPQVPPATVASPSPVPSPSATTTPIPPSPQPTGTPTPSPFNYVVTPSPSPANALPRILEVAVNDKVLHRGQMLLVRVMTSPDVTSVIARTWGYEVVIPRGAPGYFAGQEQLPAAIPWFLLNRTFDVEVVASTADGRSASFKVPLRLER